MRGVQGSFLGMPLQQPFRIACLDDRDELKIIGVRRRPLRLPAAQGRRSTGIRTRSGGGGAARRQRRRRHPSAARKLGQSSLLPLCAPPTPTTTTHDDQQRHPTAAGHSAFAGRPSVADAPTACLRILRRPRCPPPSPSRTAAGVAAGTPARPSPDAGARAVADRDGAAAPTAGAGHQLAGRRHDDPTAGPGHRHTANAQPAQRRTVPARVRRA